MASDKYIEAFSAPCYEYSATGAATFSIIDKIILKKYISVHFAYVLNQWFQSLIYKPVFDSSLDTTLCPTKFESIRTENLNSLRPQS